MEEGGVVPVLQFAASTKYVQDKIELATGDSAGGLEAAVAAFAREYKGSKKHKLNKLCKMARHLAIANNLERHFTTQGRAKWLQKFDMLFEDVVGDQVQLPSACEQFAIGSDGESETEEVDAAAQTDPPLDAHKNMVILDGFQAEHALAAVAMLQNSGNQAFDLNAMDGIAEQETEEADKMEVDNFETESTEEVAVRASVTHVTYATELAFRNLFQPLEVTDVVGSESESEEVDETSLAVVNGQERLAMLDTSSYAAFNGHERLAQTDTSSLTAFNGQQKFSSTQRFGSDEQQKQFEQLMGENVRQPIPRSESLPSVPSLAAAISEDAKPYVVPSTEVCEQTAIAPIGAETDTMILADCSLILELTGGFWGVEASVDYGGTQVLPIKLMIRKGTQLGDDIMVLFTRSSTWTSFELKVTTWRQVKNSYLIIAGAVTDVWSKTSGFQKYCVWRIGSAEVSWTLGGEVAWQFEKDEA